MKQQTFWTWLMNQRKRNDPVGDLANDCYRDRVNVSGLTGLQLVRHLNLSIYACKEAVDAARQARLEHRLAILKAKP